MTSAAARMLALTYTLITPTQGGNILRCPLAHFYSAVDSGRSHVAQHYPTAKIR
jgi:hypothetical protein